LAFGDDLVYVFGKLGLELVDPAQGGLIQPQPGRRRVENPFLPEYQSCRDWRSCYSFLFVAILASLESYDLQL
jgi:hypothetical protein